MESTRPSSASASRRRARRRGRRARLLETYAHRPLGLLRRYIGRRALYHAVILLSVFAAVVCALASQYAVKNLIDALGVGRAHPAVLRNAFLLLVALIFADSLLWRVGGWFAARAFVAVTGDIRMELFEYLLGHPPAYFSDKQPGMVSSRVSAVANAVYTAENTVTWTALPPCLSVIGAIAIVASVNPLMSAALAAVSVSLALVLFWFAGHGTSRHQNFALQAASVDGELVDVLGNMGMVRAFGAAGHEHGRFDLYLSEEMGARRISLRYLEKLRILHAAVTVLLSAGLLGRILWLWSVGRATTGDVVLVSSLGFTILHGTRDLAVALVDVTQHIARLAEALETLLVPHGLPEPEDAKPLEIRDWAAGIDFEDVTFAYPGASPAARWFQPAYQAGRTCRARRPVRCRQVNRACITSTLLRASAWSHPDSRAGRLEGYSGDPPCDDLGRSSGCFAFSPVAARESSLRQARCNRGTGSRGL